MADHVRHVAEAPHRQRIFIGDKSKRTRPPALQPPRQKHAERLVREAAFERIANEIELVGARKGLDDQFAHARHMRHMRLQRQPFGDLVGQAFPGLLAVEQFADALGEIGRERKLAAHIGRHAGILVIGARDVDLVLDQRFVAYHLAAEHEGVADHEILDEVLLDLAEHAPAARQRAGGPLAFAVAAAHQPHPQHGVLDDGADIHAVHLPHLGIGDAPPSLLVLFDAREALIALQRVAARGDEIERVVKIGAGHVGVRRGGADFLEQIVGEKRLAASAPQNVLRQNVERPGAQRWRVLRTFGDGIYGDAAFQHFEAIGRHQHRARGLVDTVIGAADPLHQPRRALRRADIDDQIDIAPVDAEVERGGADDALQLACGHRVLDAAALPDIERAVMQRDRKVVVVHPPQVLEQHLGLAAGIDEDQRGPVGLDEVVDLAKRMPRGMTGPRQPLAGVEHLDHRRGRAAGRDDIGRQHFAVGLRHQEARQRFRFGDGGRQADDTHLRRQLPQPRQPERQEVTAFRGHQRVQLVEHDALQRAEQERRIVGR